MKDGFMQQVDEPLNLYDYPINQFVAGFIGTPQMNFFDAVLTGTKNKVYLEFGEDKVLLPKEKVALICNLDAYLNTGKKIVFGIRPEDIKCNEALIGENKESCIKVGVEFIEGLGAETLLYCKTKDVIDNGDIIEVKSNLTAKVESRTLAKVGDEVEIYLNLAKAHLFDKDTEITIVARTEEGKAEIEALQAARVEEDRIKAEELAQKEAAEAEKLAIKLAKKNKFLKSIGLGKKETAENAEEATEEAPADEQE
jgi:multiple sugar transport system ATP-binding protein